MWSKSTVFIYSVDEMYFLIYKSYGALLYITGINLMLVICLFFPLLRVICYGKASLGMEANFCVRKIYTIYLLILNDVNFNGKNAVLLKVAVVDIAMLFRLKREYCDTLVKLSLYIFNRRFFRFYINMYFLSSILFSP